MTLRELLDTLVAHAGGDDGIAKELQAEVEEAISTFDDMWYVVSDHCEDKLQEWFATRSVEDRLLNVEEAAYLSGAKLAGETVELPDNYVRQGEYLHHD